MVAQFTQQQTTAPPQTTSQSLSPAQWAQLAQLIQNQPQTGYHQQVAPPSTSAYTSSGTMSAIDPALLQAQWLQYQQNQLAQSAIIPQVPQYQQQYQPAQGGYLSNETIDAIAHYTKTSEWAASAAAQYINYLRGELSTVDAGYIRLLEFSAIQGAILEKFLFNREFTLDYIRGIWPVNGVDNNFMNKFADVYLEIDELLPLADRQNRNPEFTGNQNLRFDAVVPQLMQSTIPLLPQLVQKQSTIPPLPSSNGSTAPYITLDRYLEAQKHGQLAQVRASALQNPTGLYSALFQ